MYKLKYKTEIDFRLKEILRDIIRRCYDNRRQNYKYYGERGITVCEEWREDFFCFRDWALKTGYRKGLSIDRIDSKGNYCPENCRWVDVHTQCANRNKRSDNKSGYTGVVFNKARKNWTACIGINGKLKYLGCAKTPEEAKEIRNQYIIQNNLTEYNLQ